MKEYEAADFAIGYEDEIWTQPKTQICKYTPMLISLHDLDFCSVFR